MAFLGIAMLCSWVYTVFILRNKGWMKAKGFELASLIFAFVTIVLFIVGSLS